MGVGFLERGCSQESQLIRTPALELLSPKRPTHKAVLELDDVAVGDALQDRDLRLEVLEQLGRELAPDDGLDRDGGLSVLFRRAGPKGSAGGGGGGNARAIDASPRDAPETYVSHATEDGRERS